MIFHGCSYFVLIVQHSEEMYDPEIYRHPIAEYYNPYVLDADIQTGEFTPLFHILCRHCVSLDHHFVVLNDFTSG